jgi:hypothetical protein
MPTGRMNCLFALNGLYPVGVQDDENEGDEENDHQAGEGEILDEAKRLYFFFGNASIHRGDHGYIL